MKGGRHPFVVKAAVGRPLTAYFARNGNVRRKNEERHAAEGSQAYRKGDEIRLVAKSQEELAHMQALLTEAGFVYGKPFAKNRQFCQPIYGRPAVARFLEMVEKYSPNNVKATARGRR